MPTNPSSTVVPWIIMEFSLQEAPEDDLVHHLTKAWTLCCSGSCPGWVLKVSKDEGYAATLGTYFAPMPLSGWIFLCLNFLAYKLWPCILPFSCALLSRVWLDSIPHQSSTECKQISLFLIFSTCAEQKTQLLFLFCREPFRHPWNSLCFPDFSFLLLVSWGYYDNGP